jgi:endonuclease YncB( thermonuclease family)
MVRDGFARAMSDWHLDYASAEFEARRLQRGLWSGDPANGIGDPAVHRRVQACRDGAGGKRPDP